ncbi:hypothetical protein [Haloferula sp. BvORR071]|uniref:hypothetical protein n=1 Tax=Haloferula sp. BvORR071 TaxID=1396141 RepID=UPI00055615F5|nr:hypothetical protein [Haloferula sp. BvORR071]
MVIACLLLTALCPAQTPNAPQPQTETGPEPAAAERSPFYRAPAGFINSPWLVWDKYLGYFAGTWTTATGGFRGVLANRGVKWETGGEWPDLDALGEIELSEQMDFLSASHRYELFLGDLPEKNLLLIRHSADPKAVPEYRVLLRNGWSRTPRKEDDFLSSEQTGWRLAFLKMSGEWKSEKGGMSFRLNYRTLTFTEGGPWPEATGRQMLLGEQPGFIIGGKRCLFKYLNDNLKEVSLFREGEGPDEWEMVKCTLVK